MFIVKKRYLEATEESEQEARREPRKIVRCPAKVLLKDGTMLPGRTLDVSLSGMAVMLDSPLDNDGRCTIAFSALAEGEVTHVSVTAETVYCICVGMSGFRVGFKFDDHDEMGAKLVRRIVR